MQDMDKFAVHLPDGYAQSTPVLVAFSGTVKVDEVEYTEAGLNFDEHGQPITTDKKFRKAFRSDRYNILVVANKYQTGFDEPLLHSMYVDKKLKGVNAVQTLSRLNRTCRGKDSTFVLDFENTDQEKFEFRWNIWKLNNYFSMITLINFKSKK